MGRLNVLGYYPSKKPVFTFPRGGNIFLLISCSIMQKQNNGCAVVFLVGIIILIIWYIDSSLHPKPSPAATRSHEVVARPKEWYEGGTLHQSKISDWKNASYENRLATSYDFIVTLYKVDGLDFPPLPEAKEIAIGFEKGISNVAREPYAQDQDVSTIAATVWALMK